MNIYLEIYALDAAGMIQSVWRRTLFGIDKTPIGTNYLLYSKDNQKWLFPAGCKDKGEHYDTKLDAWVSWITLIVNPEAVFDHFGFSSLDRSRWST